MSINLVFYKCIWFRQFSQIWSLEELFLILCIFTSHWRDHYALSNMDTDTSTVRKYTYVQINTNWSHNDDVIMAAIASQITSPMIVYSTVYSDADHRKYQSSASLAFVRGIHRRPVNSPQKCPVTRKMFPFHDLIIPNCTLGACDIGSTYPRLANTRMFSYGGMAASPTRW